MSRGRPTNSDTQATCSLLPAGSGPPIMTFTQFRSVKENERQSRFQSKSSKKQKTGEKTASEKLVNIKTAVMTYREDHGTLKVVRGTQHTVSVSPNINAKDLRMKVVEKQSRFNRHVTNCAYAYYLLYPDMNLIEKIPGTEEDFTLIRYKQELGKAYERIVFYLCTTTDYLANEGIVLTDSESDGDQHAAEVRANFWLRSDVL